jgi:CotH kinase protein
MTIRFKHWVISACIALLSWPVHMVAQDFYGSGIREVRLEVNLPRWEVRLDSMKNANPEARILGTAWIDGVRFDSVGIRFKGNSSYFRTRRETYKKLPFNIKLDYKVKTQKLREGQTSVRLSNAFLDPGFLRDPLSYEIARRYMPASLCNFTRLYVNGKFYGVYVNTEAIDYNFIKKHFGVERQGFLVKCDPVDWQQTRSQSGCPKGENASLVYLNDNAGCYGAFYEVDNVAAWKPMLRMIRTLNRAPEQIESVLDVDQALWMLAFNNMMVNLDSYNGSLSHNYYLWFDTSGVAHPLIWDLNMSIGGWRRNNSMAEMSDDELIQYSPLAESTNPKRPLLAQLLRQPLFRKIYIAHCRTIVAEHLQNNAWVARATAMTRDIDPWVQKDSLKLYSYEAFQKSMDHTMASGTDRIIGLRQLLDKRGQWLAKHPLLTKTPPAISETRHTKQADGRWLVTARLTGATGGFVYQRTERWQAFRRSALLDDGQNGDAAAGDGIFSALLPAPAKHYYIAAENADAALTYPERASFEYLKIE